MDQRHEAKTAHALVKVNQSISYPCLIGTMRILISDRLAGFSVLFGHLLPPSPVVVSYSECQRLTYLIFYNHKNKRALEDGLLL